MVLTGHGLSYGHGHCLSERSVYRMFHIYMVVRLCDGVCGSLIYISVMQLGCGKETNYIKIISLREALIATLSFTYLTPMSALCPVKLIWMRDREKAGTHIRLYTSVCSCVDF